MHSALTHCILGRVVQALLLLVLLVGCSKDKELVNSCCSDDAFQVKGGHAPHVYLFPNVITPNNDFKNDQFHIGAFDTSRTATSHNAVFTVRKLAVLSPSKSGGLVYQNDNYQNTFDGHDNNGNELPEGKYLYVAQLDEVTVTGNLCLVRSLKPCRCRSIDPDDPMLPNCN